MSTCIVSGTFLDPHGTGISGATLRFATQNPVVDASGNIISPYELTTTTAVGGTWSLTLVQAITGVLTLDLSAIVTAPIVKYKFSMAIPQTSTALFAACWVDSPSYSGTPTNLPLSFIDISGQLATGQLPPLPAGEVWVGNVSGAAAAVVVSGDATLSATGAVTLATVNLTPNVYGDSSHVSVVNVNAKGLVTQAASLSIQIPESQVTNLVSDLAAKQATGNYITALTADVTASGPGSIAATVVQVGGVVAANVASGANLANAATDVNTTSTIVKRNGSGNFTAGTITAALTGTASGNTTVTPNNHGIVLSGSGNILSVLAPDASTTKVLTSGGASADPSWQPAGTASPLTTKGDLYGYDSTNNRIPVGTDGQFIGADSNQTLGVRYMNEAFKNLIQINSDADVSIGNWVTFADAAANRPVDGTGGSPSSTFTRTTSTPLDGAGSFLFTKAGSASRQGEGASLAFSVPNGYQGQVINLSCLYKVASGTFTASNGTTAPLNDGTTTTNAGNSDLEFFLYDVTNAVLIPVTPQVVVSNSTIGWVWQGTAQLNSNSTSYRLIIYQATTTTNNYTVQFDDFYVGMLPMKSGPVVSDWVPYTATLGGTTSAPTAGAGATQSAFWRRVGDSIEIFYTYYQSVGGADGSGTYLIPLPTGLTADTAKVSVDAGAIGVQATVLGPARSSNTNLSATVTAENGHVVLHSTTNLKVVINNTASNNLIVWGSGAQQLSTATVYTSFNAKLPIAGWSANSLTSSDAATRVVEASAIGLSSTTITAGTALIFPTMVNDTHVSYNVVTGQYTCPVSGPYMVSLTLGSLSTGTLFVYLGKNGTNAFSSLNASQFFSISTTLGAAGTRIVYCKAGDILTIIPNQSVTAGSTTGASLDISLIQGPANISVVDSVNARYYASATAISGSLATVVWTTKDYDSHNAMSSGLYTVPVPGKYQVNTNVQVTGTIALNSQLDMQLQKNTVVVSDFQTYAGGAMTAQNGQISDIINCVAGDSLRIQLLSGATLPTIASGNTKVFFSIVRVGN